MPGGLIAERVNAVLEQAGLGGLVIGLVYFVLLLGLGSWMTGSWLRRLIRKPTGAQVGGIAQRLHDFRIGPAAIWVPGKGRVSTRIPFPNSGIDEMSAFVPMAAGFVIGFIALLLGAGGGFILMPFLVYGLGVPTAVAIGTDLFQIIITGTLGAFLYSLGGHVDPVIAIIMFASASAGTQLGALATRFVNASRILGLFGVTVLNAGIGVGLRQLAQLLDSPVLAQVGQALLLGASGAVAVAILCMLAVSAGRQLRRGRRLAMLRAKRRRRIRVAQ